jgi:hypothetical protein
MAFWKKSGICLRWWLRGKFAIPLTNGFASARKRQLHFLVHGGEFGATTEIEYEEIADRFLGGPGTAMWHYPSPRPQGDLVRYDQVTNIFGVLASDGTIHTYFKPIFCSQAAPQRRAMGKCHNQNTHLEYVMLQCNKTFRPKGKTP